MEAKLFSHLSAKEFLITILGSYFYRAEQESQLEALIVLIGEYFSQRERLARVKGQEEAYEFFSADGNLRLEAPLFNEWQSSDEYKKLMSEDGQ